MRLKKSICVLAALGLLFSLFGCKKNAEVGESSTAEPASSSETIAEVFSVNGFSFSGLLPYDGPFVEDGTNEEVTGVASIRVENKNDSALRYAEFTVFTDVGELYFTCTTLLPGQSALLLEQNRAAFRGASVSSVSVNGELFFSEPPTLYPEVFSLSVSDHVLTLRNQSDSPVPGEIYVYFKRCAPQGYLGGITYRVRFSDIPAGGSLSQSSRNLSQGDCDLIFIECQNPPGAAS